MIRFATKDDTKSILNIWYKSFIGEEIFANYFFENLYDYKNSIVFEQDGKIVSTLQRIPYHIENIGQSTYIYGACTLPEYRGNGYMNKLLNVSEELDHKENIKASILIPQSDSLFEFYKRFGYEPCFYINKKTFNLEKLDNTIDFSVAKINDSYKIKNLYSSLLKDKNFIYRKSNYIEDQIKMFKSLGGEVFLLSEKNTLKGYAFVWNDDTPFIAELLYEEKAYENILANEIMHYYNIDKIGGVSPLGKNNTTLGSAKFYNVQPCEIKSNLMFN